MNALPPAPPAASAPASSAAPSAARAFASAPSPWPARALGGIAAAAIALPFLYGHTTSPLSNFWPLVVSALCALVVAAAFAIAWSRQPAGDAGHALRPHGVQG